MSNTAEPTADGHHVVIAGRRWRATDPLIPADVAAELRVELMAARRAVAAGLRQNDPAAVKVARAAVQRAKVRLGERGVPWWEQTDAERQTRWSGG